MKQIHKIGIVFLLIFALFVPNIACAISNADTMRVFKKLYQDPTFMPQIYRTVPLYEGLGVTNDSVNIKMQDIIRSVLTFAELEKEKGTLTRDNLKDRLKDITAERAMSMEAAYIALCSDAFSDETVLSLMGGNIPAEFASLYGTIASEAYVILGFGERKDITHVFDDLAGYSWAEEAIAYLFDQDIINGVSIFSFVPSANVTREQFAKMMCTAFSIEPADKKPVFTDVQESDWFYPYVTAMASQNLIQGIGQGMFGSGQSITRQDMAVLMFRMGEMLGKIDRSTSNKSGFEDDRYIASYARSAVVTMKELGMINGNEWNCFNPTMSATRAEAAQMLYRCYTYIHNQR